MSFFCKPVLPTLAARRIPLRTIHTPPRRFEPGPPIPTPPPKRPTPERRPTNRQIPFDHVYVLDPHTQRLSPTKQPLATLLSPRSVVELVAATPEPIVRVTTRAVVEARYRALRRAQEKEEKEVRLAWGVASGDVAHKLRKARRDLEKGHRVVVAVSFRGQSRRDLVAFADEIKGELAGVGEEYKERAFSERSMVLSFHSVGQQNDGS